MSSVREIDVYTEHVMSNIDPAVFSSLNLLQIQAVEIAVSSSAPFRRHGVDLRGTLRLYFAQFYFVILMGRDRRIDISNREAGRRYQAGVVSAFIMLYTLICIALPVVLLLLYGIKSWLGIDLFPDQHLSDILGL